MPLYAPFMLGPFVIDGDGRLAPSAPNHFPSFRVAWRGHTVQARLATAGPQGGALALNAVIGRVASTGPAEAPVTFPRQAAFATVRALHGMLQAGWRVSLLPDHRIVAEAQVQIDLPTAAEDLVKELTLFLLRLNPYLDLFAEGLGVEAVADGNLAPGLALEPQPAQPPYQPDGRQS